MKKSRIWYIFVVVLSVFVLFGCAKQEVTILPPLNKEIADENCAVLVIPKNAKVNRIDDKKRGLFRSWSTNSKAATLLIPAGEHTIIFRYSHPKDGWSAKKLNYTLTMNAGKMYMLSLMLDEGREKGIVFSAINVATSFVRDDVIDFLPLVDFFPRPNPEGLVYQIIEIDQTAFDQYLLDDEMKITTSVYLLGILIGGLWLFIAIYGLRLLFYFIFMGKFKNSHPVIATLLSIGLFVTGIYIIDYNTSGIFSLYLLSTLLIGIGISILDMGNAYNDRGIAALKGESVEATGNASSDLENFIGELSAIKIKNNFDKAIFHFNKAIAVSPYNAVYFYNRGLAYCRLQDWEKAIADFKKAVQLKPNNEMFKKNLADAKAMVPNSSGLVKLNNKDYNGAIADFNNAINIAPHNATYIANRGFSYFSLQDWGKAIADFNSAINLDSNNAVFINYRGLAYYHLQDWEKAITDFTEAERLDPNNDMYKKNIANTQAQVAERSRGSAST